MHQLSNDPAKTAGGDTRTPAAKAAIARREQQIVELRLRNIPFAAIGRAVGISKVSAIRAFQKALRRNTDNDIQTHHRGELAKLDMEGDQRLAGDGREQGQLEGRRLTFCDAEPHPHPPRQAPRARRPAET
jgi:hypothetical protein